MTHQKSFDLEEDTISELLSGHLRYHAGQTIFGVYQCVFKHFKPSINW